MFPNKPPKVCLLTTVHSPFDTRIFQKEAKSLKKAGYDVSLIAQHDKLEVVDGIRIFPLAKPKNRLERMTKTVWAAYQKALKVDANIYHFHDPELMPIGLLLKRYCKRIIYDVHEDVPRQNLSKPYIPAVFRKPISLIIAALEAFSARRFDGVVTATPFINKRFLELGANAVNVNNYPIISELYTPEKRWENKEKAACYVGGITKIRGAFEMLEATSKTGYRLIMAGDFEPGLQNQLEQLPGWRKVETLGFVDREGVMATMARSMAGMVLYYPEPNHISAQPNKMFEYMSAGIPVIASNFLLWREIVEKNRCGFCVDPFNIRLISEVVQWIIENPEEARRMGENGRKAVEKYYNWEVEAKNLLKLYEMLLSQ